MKWPVPEFDWQAIRAGVLGLVLMLVGVGTGHGEESGAPTEAVPSEQIIERRIAELADERFAVREKARHELLKIGRPALSKLREAAGSDSPEQRIRAAELVETIHFGRLSMAFETLGKQAEEEIDVEHGMWLIALILDPELTKESVSAKLDEIAAAVRKKIGEANPAALPPTELMRVFTGVLEDDFGLQGDEETYQDPDNSSVHRVIERKKGLPILLSEIAVAVGRRLEVPIVGLGIPGRYMIKYDGSRAPEGQKREDIIVNPYEGWVVTNAATLARTIVGFDRQFHLQPNPKRATLLRIMSNMYSHALVVRDFRLAKAIRAYEMLLVPVLPGDQ